MSILSIDQVSRILISEDIDLEVTKTLSFSYNATLSSQGRSASELKNSVPRTESVVSVAEEGSIRAIMISFVSGNTPDSSEGGALTISSKVTT